MWGPPGADSLFLSSGSSKLYIQNSPALPIVEDYGTGTTRSAETETENVPALDFA
jgi:hypothetical protein